jgi:hypothetical protein
MALEEKKMKYFDEWLEEKIKGMYVRIDDSFDTSQFERQAWVKKN